MKKLQIYLLAILLISCSHTPMRTPASSSVGDCAQIQTSLLFTKHNELEGYLREFIAKGRRDINSPEVLENKRLISEAYEALDPDAPKLNFELNLKRMIQDLSNEEQEVIWETLQNKFRHNYKAWWDIMGGKKDNGGGTFYPSSKILSVELPESLWNTEIDYFIRLHETYHLMIDVILNKRLSGQTKNKIWDMTLPIRRLYLEEMGAMVQEWYYFASMPLAKRNELLEIIKSEPRLDKSFIELIEAALKESDSTPGKHVLAQHLNKRYDPKSIERHLTAQRDLRAILAVGLPVTALLSWTATCRMDPNGEFGKDALRIFCEQNPFSYENRDQNQ